MQRDAPEELLRRLHQDQKGFPGGGRRGRAAVRRPSTAWSCHLPHPQRGAPVVHKYAKVLTKTLPPQKKPAHPLPDLSTHVRPVPGFRSPIPRPLLPFINVTYLHLPHIHSLPWIAPNGRVSSSLCQSPSTWTLCPTNLSTKRVLLPRPRSQRHL